MKLQGLHGLLVVAAFLALFDFACAESEPLVFPTENNGAAGTGMVTGAAGTDGAAGTNGAAGTFGVAGTNGRGGTTGTAGTFGAAGTFGVAGTNGRGGTTGTAGTFGAAGTNGAAGTFGRGGTTGTAGTFGRGGTTGTGGATDGGVDGAAAPTFTQVYNTILTVNCNGSSCHNPGSQRGYAFATKAGAYTAVRNDVTPGDGTNSSFFRTVNSGSMPQGGPKLSAANLALIKGWIDAGALNN